MLFLILSILFFLLCAVVSGDVFLRGVIQVSKKFKIPYFVSGIVIVSIGTSLPDLFIAATSTFRSHEISVGSIVGSGIASILLGIGIASVISKITHDKSNNIANFSIHYSSFTVFLLCAMLIFGRGQIGLVSSIILLLLVVIFLIISSGFFAEGNAEHDDKQHSKVWVMALMVLLGLFGLIFFSNFLLKFILEVGTHYSITSKIIVLNVVGPGNSLPEIIICVIAAFRKRSDIVIGSVIGSNILTIGGVLGISGIISNLFRNSEISFDLPILLVDIPILALSTSLFLILYKIKKQFSITEGLIFIFLYVAYGILQFNII